MITKWLSVIGLSLDIIGAFILAYGLIISPDEAIKLGLSRWVGDTDEENSKLPAVKDRLKQSTNAKIGVFFLIIGFIFQLLGNLPK